MSVVVGLRQVSLKTAMSYNSDSALIIPPQTVFVGGYTVFTLSIRTNERKCVRDVLFP